MRLVLLLFSLPFLTFAQLSQKEYIEKYKADAIKDMKKTGVPAAITLAQAALESENGNSPLAKGSNNHFGIKCHKEWNGPTYFHDDDKKQECFRKYKTVLESFDDHSYFLKSRPRYSSLFDLPKTDYKGWAYGLKKAGYATNPKYPELLIKIIEENNLAVLDQENAPVADDQPLLAKNADEPKKETAPAPKIIVNKTPVYSYSDVGERVKFNNDVKYVIAKPGDTYLTIANEFELGLWQIFKYNEIDKNTPLLAGQRIYLQPKKKEAQAKIHIVKRGETLHDVAQQYGIKLKHIYKYNQLTENIDLKEGQKLLLQ